MGQREVCAEVSPQKMRITKKPERRSGSY